MLNLVPSPEEDDCADTKNKITKDVVRDASKVGIIGLTIGVAIGWLAKTAFDDGKADDILKSLGLDRGNKSNRTEK